MKTIRALSGLVIFLAMSHAAAQEANSPLATVEVADDLEKVSRAAFRETYVNKTVDFTRFKKLYLGEALFDYRDVGPAQRSRSMAARSSRTAFGISDKDRDDFENLVAEAFTKELGKSKRFSIVDTFDETTIIMRGGMVDIVSRVPPEFTGRSEIYLATVGEATLVLEFLDGGTGEVLARIAERRRIDTLSGRTSSLAVPSNTVTVRADVRRWAASTARRLRNELDLAISES